MLTRLLLIGLTVTAFTTARAQRGPDSAAQSAIRSQLDQMLTAWNADDLEAHIASYADSATWTTSTGLLKGKPAIRETLIKGFRRGKWEIIHDHSS
jgi:ketosteroid isomerase-like protein